MIVSTDLTKLLLAGMKTNFMKELKETPVIHTAISTMMNSTKDKETYPWLGENPEVSEWLDERQERALAEHEFEIVNRSWENTLSVDRDTLEDERLSSLNSVNSVNPITGFFYKILEMLMAIPSQALYEGKV